MATAKTTIELNGKLYDARTGKVISETKNLTAPVMPQSNTGVIDGFSKGRTATSSSSARSLDGSTVVSNYQQAPSGIPGPGPGPTKLKKSGKAHALAPAAKQPVQKSKTLMRPAVKKPSKLTDAKKSSQTGSIKPHHNANREHRANTIKKSPVIQRFNIKSNAVVARRMEPVKVKPQRSAQTNQIANQVAHLATATETQISQVGARFESSIQNANSHLEKLEDDIAKKTRQKFLGMKPAFAKVSALSLAALLLVGFFAYQNVPNLEMRLAASRAGISAKLPGYQPSGYSVDRGFNVEPGKVTVGFNSNSNNKTFSLAQQASAWSSDALLKNHVLASGKPYQTYQDKGKTVYIYDNSNATWVNGGIWYTVQGDASLTSDQLLRIAGSI